MTRERLLDMGNSVPPLGPRAIDTPEASPCDEKQANMAVSIALNVASRLGKKLSAAALALLSEILNAWHARINRNTGAILKSRPDAHARNAALGNLEVTLRDLAEAATNGGEEGRAAVLAVCEILKRACSPKMATAEMLADQTVRFSREASDVHEALTLGRSPEHQLRELDEADAQSARLRSILEQQMKAGRS